MKIIDKIGTPAMLEQCAEECAELSHACLKLARKLRDENPTPSDTELLIENLNEEAADVWLVISLLEYAHILHPDDILNIMNFKRDRWRERLGLEHMGGCDV